MRINQKKRKKIESVNGIRIGKENKTSDNLLGYCIQWNSTHLEWNRLASGITAFRYIGIDINL